MSSASRRGILAALAVAALDTASALHVADLQRAGHSPGRTELPVVSRPSDPDADAEAAFLAWLAAAGRFNREGGSGGLSGGEWDARGDALFAMEDAFTALAPSVGKAAGLILLDLCYSLNTDGPRTLVAVTADDNDIRLAVRVLESLRPSLSGRIADIAGDLLDTTHLPASASLLIQAYGGTAT